MASYLTVMNLFYILVILNVIDLLLTISAIRKNQASESNPIAKVFMKILGTEEGLIFVKLAYVIYVWTDLNNMTVNDMYIAIGIYIAVLARNIYIISKAKKQN